jgi:hypothetical protein
VPLLHRYRDHVEQGWWVTLAGDVASLRELAMSFGRPELQIVEEDDGFYLGSTDFNELERTDDVRLRAAELLSTACGSAAIELGGVERPRLEATVRVDASGKRERLTLVGASSRMPFDINAHVERLRDDGQVEVVEVAPPLPRPEEWTQLARENDDVADALAILGRDDVRWHDLYHVFEIVERNVGGQMVADGWTTKADVRRFTQTANSRVAIGREARHGKEIAAPTRVMELTEARRLVVSLVRHWLETLVLPALPRVVRVVEVRPAPEAPAAAPQAQGR